ncbi:MAG: tetratricopeptide repeat protein [Cyanobacteria bacterium]|nr:tetratricopeptide repeat protein [Cyanobacteriota bacterium]
MKTTSLYLFVLALMTPALMGQPCFSANFETGLRVYQEGDYAMAIRYFQQAVKEHAENPNIRYYLADSFLKTNRLPEAQSEYQHILAIAPTSQAAKLSKIGLSQIEKYHEPSVTKFKEVIGSIKDNNGPDKFSGLDAKGTNYLDEVMEGGQAARWSTKALPLKLYIETAPPNIRNFEQSFIAQVQRAMEAWNKALGSQLLYTLVDSPSKGDIRVSWVNNIDKRGFTTESGTTYTAGVTLPNISNDRLQYMDVRLGTFDIREKPQSADDIYVLALHELGHALGLRGHSPDIKDIMFAQNQNVRALSQRDINTIRLLYSQEPDITNLPKPKNKAPDPEREKRIAERMDAEIAKLETEIKTNGSHLNLNNLGSSYYQKGKTLPGTAQTPAKREYYEKAIDTFTRAIPLEPTDASTYYNRCIVYQEIGKKQEALEDIELSIRYDDRESKYFLEKAWILSHMNRKSEAKTALEAYLLKEPQNAQSESVQKIRKLVNAGNP